MKTLQPHNVVNATNDWEPTGFLFFYFLDSLIWVKTTPPHDQVIGKTVQMEIMKNNCVRLRSVYVVFTFVRTGVAGWIDRMKLYMS